MSQVAPTDCGSHVRFRAIGLCVALIACVPQTRDSQSNPPAGSAPAGQAKATSPEKSAESAKKRAEPQKPEVASRQVTLFGILADPAGNTMDPKLEAAAPQLRKLFPNHSFKLIEARTKRLSKSESLTCDLGEGYIAEAWLSQPQNSDGKVELKVALVMDGMNQISLKVSTPPNQLLFCDKKLPDGTRLLIGVGAR